MNDRTVYRLEKDGTRTILADRYEGKRFNGPNDIVVKSDGAVYFTDTVWGLRGADEGSEARAALQRLLSDEGRQGDPARQRQGHAGRASPNGITLSPDEKYLYVTAGARRTMRYDILPDDTVSQREGCSSSTEGTACAWIPERQPLYDQRRHARHASRSRRPRASRSAGCICRSRRRAAGSRVRHERGVRRCRRSRPLHHGVHASVQAPDEDAGDSSRSETLIRDQGAT